MICRNCNTLNLDQHDHCLECHQPLIFVQPIEKPTVQKPATSIYGQLPRPRHFTLGWKLRGNLFSLIPLIAFVWLFYHEITAPELSLNDELIKLLRLLVSCIGFFTVQIFLLPLWGGNPKIHYHFNKQPGDFVVQVSFTPRRFTGLEGYIDDADDFGKISFLSDRIIFQGDSTSFEIYADNIINYNFKNTGSREFWILGREINLTLHRAVLGSEKFRIYPRMGSNIYTCRRYNKRFQQAAKQFFERVKIR